MKNNLFSQMKMPASAVLIAVVRNKNSFFIPLTKRAKTLKKHTSQICLPGGFFNLSDNSLEETALREFEEELGVYQEKITIKGILNDQVTSQGVHVRPFWGLVSGQPEFKIQTDEVEQLIELPLQAIQDLESFKLNTNPECPVFTHKLCTHYKEHLIWGITATILHEFSKKIIPTPYFIESIQELNNDQSQNFFGSKFS